MINMSTLTDNLDVIATQLDESRQMALVALTGDTRIIDYNSGFANLIERSDNLKDVDLKTLLLPENRAAFDNNLDKRSPLQLNFSLSDNNSLDLRCTFHPNRTGYLMFGEQPILADSQVMRTLSKLNNELAGLTREQNRNNRALKVLQLQLQKKNEELEQFVHIVSHDLKSPLVTVKSAAGMLRQDIQDSDQQRINEDLNYIDKAADKMQQLLDALLQYSRIGGIDTRAQTLSADQQVQDCLATLAGILQQHQVQVSTGNLPHQLHGDPLHFGQIWQNLIENAVKYRGDQPQPHIEIGAMQKGQEVVFCIRDNGMGIAPEHKERIFNLFSQLNPGSDGSGLGLALVKKIVSIYQGRIWG